MLSEEGLPTAKPEEINEKELMDHFRLSGRLGRLRLKLKLLRSWLLSGLAKRVPTCGMAVALHRLRGVKIGKHVYIGPRVEIDMLYPHLVTLEDHVSIGMGTLIFAHSNPTFSIRLKAKVYPRKTSPVAIRKGAWIAPGCIILCGVTVGQDAVVGAGSVVIRDVEPATVVAGNPATLIKRLEL
jgi:acetyltransferase-like isoleucine patch superfamily enzyme